MPEVLVYSSAWCPYCIRAKQLLTSKGVAFREISVDGQPDVRAEMSRKAGRTSVPQIWIGSTHVGGCDDLYALERAGKLDALLADSDGAAVGFWEAHAGHFDAVCPTHARAVTAALADFDFDLARDALRACGDALGSPSS